MEEEAGEKIRFAPCRQMNPRPRGPRKFRPGGAPASCCCVRSGAPLPSPSLAARLEEGLVIRQLKFSGNQHVDAKLLAASIATTNSSFFAATGWVRWPGRQAPPERAHPPRRRGPAEDLLPAEGLPGRAGRHHRDPHHRRPTSPFTPAPVLVRTLEIRGLDSLDHRDRWCATWRSRRRSLRP